jgi:hypothetical protein
MWCGFEVGLDSEGGEGVTVRMCVRSRDNLQAIIDGKHKAALKQRSGFFCGWSGDDKRLIVFPWHESAFPAQGPVTCA